jgi:hypothetical protein
VACQSPNPAKGESLYALGDIAKHEKLYREVGGDKEDKFISRDDERVQLKEDDHFYSQRVVTIIVGQDEHEIQEKEISYTQVVELYLGSGGETSTEYLIKYSHGPVENPKGTLPPGQKVKVKDGMHFRVSGTGES